MTRGGRLRFRVACPRSDRGACVGVLSAYVKRVKLGQRAFAVRAGRTAFVSLKVSRKRQRYVKRLRSARATLVATTLDSSGRQVHRRARFRVRSR
jgi:hypothetical protein